MKIVLLCLLTRTWAAHVCRENSEWYTNWATVAGNIFTWSPPKSFLIPSQFFNHSHNHLITLSIFTPDQNHLISLTFIWSLSPSFDNSHYYLIPLKSVMTLLIIWPHFLLWSHSHNHLITLTIILSLSQWPYEQY